MKWPQIGAKRFFPTNPNLADILGRTDLDFENLIFGICLDPTFPDFQVPDFQISRNPGLGLAWVRLGPGWARLGPYWVMCKVDGAISPP